MSPQGTQAKGSVEASKSRSGPMKHGRYVGLRKLARQHGVSPQFLMNRINYGYTLEQALTMPKHAQRPRRKKLVAVGIERILRSWERS